MTMVGRIWAAVTGLIVVCGIVIQLVTTANGHEGFYPDNPERVFNVFAYFTIQSNLLLGGTALMLAAQPDRPSGRLRRLLARSRLSQRLARMRMPKHTPCCKPRRDRKSTRLNSSHLSVSRMPSSA